MGGARPEAAPFACDWIDRGTVVRLLSESLRPLSGLDAEEQEHLRALAEGEGDPDAKYLMARMVLLEEKEEQKTEGGATGKEVVKEIRREQRANRRAKRCACKRSVSRRTRG